VIEWKDLCRNTFIRHLLETGRSLENESGTSDPAGIAKIPAEDAWLRSLPGVHTVFPERAMRCDHYLLPLWAMQNAACKPMGFAIVDRPYVHYAEWLISSALPLT